MNEVVQTAALAYQRAADTAQREQLILDHVDYVRKIVSMMTANLPEHCDRENLQQSALTALVEAAQAFDPTRGVKFRTYVFPRIRGAVLDELRRNSLVPQAMMQMIGHVKAAYDRMQGPVTPENLSAATGYSVQEVQEVLEALRFMQPEPWSDLFSHIHATWKHAADAPSAALEAAETKDRLANCIEKLPERERLILTLYFAEDLTLAEIGQVVNISESRVSRILATAKFRLKEMLRHGED